MRISGRGKETYLYLSGLRVDRSIRLNENVELLPAQCSPAPADIIDISNCEIDIGVAAIFLRSVASQICVRASSCKDLAVTAWNTNWDILLLGAFCNCEVVCNLQCDVPAEKFDSKSCLEITNYHLRGLSSGSPHLMTTEEATWLESNIVGARSLLDSQGFETAIHCLATCRWHSLPRVQLAVLWAGIESLFRIESEIGFRLSLYSARFLEPDDRVEQSKVFANVKRLYRQRSAAVHGSNVKDNLNAEVSESATLLLRLLRRCVQNKALPETDMLAP